MLMSAKTCPLELNGAFSLSVLVRVRIDEILTSQPMILWLRNEKPPIMNQSISSAPERLAFCTARSNLATEKTNKKGQDRTYIQQDVNIVFRITYLQNSSHEAFYRSLLGCRYVVV
jgi:hypothetical protein